MRDFGIFGVGVLSLGWQVEGLRLCAGVKFRIAVNGKIGGPRHEGRRPTISLTTSDKSCLQNVSILVDPDGHAHCIL